jgi:hypothetical protein
MALVSCHSAIDFVETFFHIKLLVVAVAVAIIILKLILI